MSALVVPTRAHQHPPADALAALDPLRHELGVQGDAALEELRAWAVARADEILAGRPAAPELRLLLGEGDPGAVLEPASAEQTGELELGEAVPAPTRTPHADAEAVPADNSEHVEHVEHVALDEIEEHGGLDEIEELDAIEELDEIEELELEIDIDLEDDEDEDPDHPEQRREPADGDGHERGDPRVGDEAGPASGPPAADRAGAGAGVPEVVLDPGTWPVAPFRITFNTWASLVSTWDAQLKHGAFFVQTDQRLGPDDEAELTFVLPRYRIELSVNARVMQSVPGETPGYAMQFMGVDDARREGMRRLVEQARAYEAGTRDAVPDPSVLRVTALDDGSFRWHLTPAEQLDLQDMRAEIGRIANASAARILGVEEDADPQRARERFFDLAQRWHPRRFAAPEIREVAEAIFMRHEAAYRDFQAAAKTRPAPAASPDPARLESGPAPDTDADLAEAQASRSGVFTGRSIAAPGRTRVKSKRRATSVLAKKLLSTLGGPEPRPAPASEAPPAPSPAASMTDNAAVRPSEPAEHGSSFERAFSAATDRLQQKRYDEAIQLFETAIRLRPNSKRAKVLHGFARARQAVAHKDFDAAARAYADILVIDPNNERAEKEKIMIAAVAQPHGG